MRARPPLLETTALRDELSGRDRCNLTNGQLVVWLGQRLAPDAPCGNVGFTFEIEGRLDPLHFAAAHQALVDRSDALRTVVEEIDGVPRQRVLAPQPCPVPVVRLPTTGDTATAARSWARSRASRPLLLTERLFDTALLQAAPERWIWYLNVHHLVVDAFGCWLIHRQVADLYRRSLDGTLHDAPPLPAFHDYVAAERRARRAPAWGVADAFWREVLARPFEPVEFYGVGPGGRTGQQRRVAVDLGAERTRSLRALAASPRFRSLNDDLSLLGVWAAVLFAYLHRMSGRRSLSVGVPLRNRGSAERRETIGMLLQTYPLQVGLGEDETFATVVAKAARGLWEVLRQAPDGTGNATHQAVNDVVLNYPAISFPDFAGMTCRPERLDSGASDGSHSLVLTLQDFGATGRLGLELDFDAGVFGHARREAAASHLVKALDQLLARPDVALDDIDLLAPAERRHVVVELNLTDREAPPARTVDELVAAQAQRTPHDVAVVHGHRVLGYAELDGTANQLAHHLRSLGVGPGVLVAVHGERGLALMVALLAIVRSGGAYLPLDTSYPPSRLQFILEDSRAGVLVAGAGSDLPVPEGTAVLRVDDLPALAAPHPRTPPPSGATPEDPAYVIYTSGSTGRPKGAVIPHRALLNVIWWQVHWASRLARPRTLQFSPLSFDVSLQETFATWSAGGTLVLPTRDVRRDPDGLLELLIDAGIEQLYTIFTPLQELADVVERRNRVPVSLREVFTAGEKVTITPSVARFFERLPGCRFQNQYGSSENLIATAHTLAGPPADWPRTPPIGRPIWNTRLYLLDARQRPVPAGVPGEICIGGAQVPLGYLHRPDLTAERLVPDPFGGEPGGRLLRQGDLARFLPDGTIEFIGRADDQVKLRGYRVEPGEIEAVLSNHPLVQEAVVVAREHRRSPALVAYIVAAPAWSPRSLSELRRSLLETLPAYAVPAAFVTVPSIPRTPSGKVDRRSLPPPDPERPELGVDYAAPRTDLERAVAAIWREVLDLGRVGRDDDFFALGGHSLLLVQVHSRLGDALGRAVDITDLFRFPTIAGLAAFLDGRGGDGGLEEAARRAALQREARRQASSRGSGGRGREARRG